MVSSVSLTMSNFGKIWNFSKRVAEVVPELIFGSASEAVGDSFRSTKGSLFKKAEAGWHTLEKAGSGSFFANFAKNFKSFIPCIKSNILTATSAAKLTGKNTLWAGTKGFFKGIGKKMPFLGSLSMMLFELPNIWKATKEQGIFQGGAEVLKSGARLAGGGLGAAIGSAVIPIPFVGSMVGWVAGEWLTSKIVGKSYSQQQEEKNQQAQEQNQQQVEQNPQGTQIPPQEQQYPQQTQPQTQPVQSQPQLNPFWINDYMQKYNQQTKLTNQAPQQPQFNGNNAVPVQPSFSGNMTGMYNPFAAQNIPYADDIMMQQMPFNKVM